MHTQISPQLPAPNHFQGGLYLVATPIGNLRDITLRALDVLQAADLIYCEDTRVTGKLLSAFGIKKPLAKYNDHTNEKVRKEIIRHVEEGKIIALVSDAGMPMISDPGHKLVRDMVKADLPVTSLPGANAVLPALQLSALPSERFTFHGFLPNKAEARKALLQHLKTIPISQVFYETALRIEASLADIQSVFGDREVAVARELTKKFEEVIRGSISDVLPQCAKLKGEIVLVVEGAEKEPIGEDQLEELLKSLLKTQSVKDAVKEAQNVTGLPKKQIYALALELKE